MIGLVTLRSDVTNTDKPLAHVGIVIVIRYSVTQSLILRPSGLCLDVDGWSIHEVILVVLTRTRSVLFGLNKLVRLVVFIEIFYSFTLKRQMVVVSVFFLVILSLFYFYTLRKILMASNV